MTRSASDPSPTRQTPPPPRAEGDGPVHERPLLELPDDEPTGTVLRFVLVAGAILGAMIAAAVVVFLLIYWKAQHR